MSLYSGTCWNLNRIKVSKNSFNRSIKFTKSILHPALYELNYVPAGFKWIDYGDGENSVLAYIRRSENERLVVVLNFSPVVRHDYRIGVPDFGTYKEIFNSDDKTFWGSGIGNAPIKSENIASHGLSYSIRLTLPPLAGIILSAV